MVVAGGILLLSRVDKSWMERLKGLEHFNKESLIQKLVEANDNMINMRESLHRANNISQAILAENHVTQEDINTLRSQFIGIYNDFKDVNKHLIECENDRIFLHKKMMDSINDKLNLNKTINMLHENIKRNEERIDVIEENSGEHKIIK